MTRHALVSAAAIAAIIIGAAVFVSGCSNNNVASSGGAPGSGAAPGSSAGSGSPGGQASPLASAVVAAPTVTLGQQTKSSGCQVNGQLPDRACTPGAIIAGATKAQICQPGYSRSVRNVPEAEKRQVYAEYGIRSHAAGAYEVDHLISLELGGSNEVSNLWPEAAAPTPGFHEKDRYENHAHQQVCSGAITLQEAQRRISEDWLKYWTEAGMP
ncbi:MAG: HNH endonuclease [Dehalococcoidia bacterium]